MLHTKEKKVSSLKVNVLQNLVSLILEQKFLRRARAPLSMIHNCGIFNFNLNSYWRQRRIRLSAVCIPHVPVISLLKSSKHIWLVFYFCMIIYITESRSIWSYAINTRIYIYLRLLHSFSLIFFFWNSNCVHTTLNMAKPNHNRTSFNQFAIVHQWTYASFKFLKSAFKCLFRIVQFIKCQEKNQRTETLW